MKRLMQAMLSVALVLVIAFTFCIDTASAQPASICGPSDTCIITPKVPFTFTRTGGFIEFTLRNPNPFAVQALIVVSGQNIPVMIAANGSYSQIITPNRADVLVFNIGSGNIFGSFRTLG